MQIVTVGGSGFLGGHVAQALSNAGHKNRILTRQASRRGDLRLLDGVELINASPFDQDALQAQLEGADAVVSMAGILNESGNNGKGFHRVHVELVEQVIAACKAQGVGRVLHVSALGAGEGESFYLQTKGEAEKLLGDSNLDVTVFRPSVIFGRGDSFFNRFGSLLKLAPVMPLACPNSKLQPVWAKDVADAMTLALASEQAIGATWELGGPKVYTLRELVAWTAQTLGLKRAIIGLPDGISRLQAMMMNYLPGKPFSTDNFRSLQLDNVTSDNALPRLGFNPASIDAIVPDYLVESPRQSRLDESRRQALRRA